MGQEALDVWPQAGRLAAMRLAAMRLGRPTAKRPWAVIFPPPGRLRASIGSRKRSTALPALSVPASGLPLLHPSLGELGRVWPKVDESWPRLGQVVQNLAQIRDQRRPNCRPTRSELAICGLRFAKPGLVRPKSGHTRPDSRPSSVKAWPSLAQFGADGAVTRQN